MCWFLESWRSGAAKKTSELSNATMGTATHAAIGLFKALLLRYISTNADNSTQ
jgi:hypothetical protein